MTEVDKLLGSPPNGRALDGLDMSISVETLGGRLQPSEELFLEELPWLRGLRFRV